MAIRFTFKVEDSDFDSDSDSDFDSDSDCNFEFPFFFIVRTLCNVARDRTKWPVPCARCPTGATLVL